MKNKKILIYKLKVVCSCKNIIYIFTTCKKKINIDVCYKCHSFYTGKQKISNSKGRMENLKKRFNNINYNIK